MKKPAYMTVFEELRREIVEGRYPPGGKIPSKRQLAERFSVSLITVERALGELCEEGYLRPEERKGYFVQSPKGGFFGGRMARAEKTSLTEMKEPFPFSAYAKNMRWVISEYGERILSRSLPQGTLELRSALASYLVRSRGILVREEQIVVGAGSEYLYGLLIQTLGRDTVYAIEHPSYRQIERVYAANGVTVRNLALSSDGVSSEELAATDATVLHVTPYRSFPSGFSASPAKKQEYLKWASGGERWIIEDDFSSEFHPSVRPAETLFSLDGEGRVLYLNTFSLTVAPGLRIGYMVLPERLLPVFSKKVGFYSCTVPTYEQLVLASFLSGGEFERYLNRRRKDLRKNAEESKKN